MLDKHNCVSCPTEGSQMSLTIRLCCRCPLDTLGTIQRYRVVLLGPSISSPTQTLRVLKEKLLLIYIKTMWCELDQSCWVYILPGASVTHTFNHLGEMHFLERKKHVEKVHLVKIQILHGILAMDLFSNQGEHDRNRNPTEINCKIIHWIRIYWSKDHYFKEDPEKCWYITN
jgi:hypothetical protein